MTAWRWTRVAFLVCASMAATPLTHAAERPGASAASPDPRRSEAQIRFDRGLELLEQHKDPGGALAELERAQELAPSSRTLFLIGVVHGLLGRPVEGLQALDRVLETPGDLSADQVAVVRQRRHEMAGRVGYLRVASNVEGTRIDVDGVPIGRTPLETRVPVSAGRRSVAALASGYMPDRKEVVVAGGTEVSLKFDLVATELRAAHVAVAVNVPAADVLIDGERAGTTPLVASMTVAPGTHVVEARRPGYRSERREIVLGDGATAALKLVLSEDPASPAAHGRLALSTSEQTLDVTVDGARLGGYRAALALPAGPHLVRVERPGFIPSERLVEVPVADELTWPVVLEPTPETKDAYVTHARRVRRWGWVMVGAGAALALGGSALAVHEWSAVDDARGSRDTVLASFNTGQPCWVSGGGDHEACDARLQSANDAVRDSEIWRAAATTAAGLGAAAALVGAVLLLTGDDPARYDRPRAAPAIPGLSGRRAGHVTGPFPGTSVGFVVAPRAIGLVGRF